MNSEHSGRVLLSYVSSGNKNVPLFCVERDVLELRPSQYPFTESQTKHFLNWFRVFCD